MHPWEVPRSSTRQKVYGDRESFRIPWEEVIPHQWRHASMLEDAEAVERILESPEEPDAL